MTTFEALDMQERRRLHRMAGAGTLQPGMRRYRFPTSILWMDNGYRLFQAADADNALFIYQRDWELSGKHVTLANLQVEVGGEWKFASEVPLMLGGYSRKA